MNKLTDKENVKKCNIFNSMQNFNAYNIVTWLCFCINVNTILDE